MKKIEGAITRIKSAVIIIGIIIPFYMEAG